MGCAASTAVVGAAPAHATPAAPTNTTKSDASATDVAGVAPSNTKYVAADTKQPAKASAVTAADLVSGGLLLLSLACEASPLPGGVVVAAVLKSIYTIFNSAVAKQIWMAEFMVRRTI